MRDCPFCHLDRERSRMLSNGKLTTTLLSNPRLMPGHTLVVPNRHVENPSDLTKEELLEIFEKIDLARKKLLESIAGGCDVRQNYRPFLPQGRIKINHVHFHVLPRTNEDELYQKSMASETDLFKSLSDSECQKMTQLLQG